MSCTKPCAMRSRTAGTVALRVLGSQGQHMLTLDEAVAKLAAEATAPDVQ